VARRWPVLMYSTYAVGVPASAILRVQRYGFSQPLRFVVWAAIFFLSLTWLLTTLRSKGPVTARSFGIRNLILILLVMAQEIAYV
jgi:hypothetical protein